MGAIITHGPTRSGWCACSKPICWQPDARPVIASGPLRQLQFWYACHSNDMRSCCVMHVLCATSLALMHCSLWQVSSTCAPACMRLSALCACYNQKYYKHLARLAMTGYASADASMVAQSTSPISGAAETALPPAPSYSPYSDDNHAQVCITSVVTMGPDDLSALRHPL